MKKADPKRKQKKNKFPNPHIKYNENQDLCQELKQKYFDLLKDPLINNCNVLTKLSIQYNVPRPTLVGWTKRWKTEPDWMPGNFSRYALVKRIFNDDTEKAISMFIEENYIKTGYYFPDSGFKDLMFHAYNENDDIKKDFHCSPGFISDFKARNRFSSRLAQIKKRPDIEKNANGKSIIDTFIQNVRDIINEANEKGEVVVNADETGWQILPPKMKTWAKINSSNIIINVKDNDKAHISAMFSITADMKKLPIFFIAKGESEVCEENQIGDDIFPNVSTHSPKAYMNTDCFLQYLSFLREQFPGDSRINLIVDSYSSHITEKSKDEAQKLNINLIFIPPGYTDKFQPLDVALFSVLKNIANAKLRKFLYEHPNKELGMKKSVEVLINAFDSISDDTLLKAWEQYL